jgi:hypothetical protein
MEDIRRGLHQLKKGQRFSFEEVFGESLKNPSGKNDPLPPGNVPGCPRPAGRTVGRRERDILQTKENINNLLFNFPLFIFPPSSIYLFTGRD